MPPKRGRARAVAAPVAPDPPSPPAVVAAAAPVDVNAALAAHNANMNVHRHQVHRHAIAQQQLHHHHAQIQQNQLAMQQHNMHQQARASQLHAQQMQQHMIHMQQHLQQFNQPLPMPQPIGVAQGGYAAYAKAVEDAKVKQQEAAEHDAMEARVAARLAKADAVSDDDGDDDDQHDDGDGDGDMVDVESSAKKKRKSSKSPKKASSGRSKRARKSADDAPSSWPCDACTMENGPDMLSCSACGSTKPAKTRSIKEWACGTCTVLNPFAATECGCCGTKRAEAQQEDEGGVVDLTDAPMSSSSSSASATTKKAEYAVIDDPIFKAGIEESFGTCDIDPYLLTRIASFVRPQWSSLRALIPQMSSTSSSSISTSCVTSMQKSLVHEASNRAMKAATTMKTIMDVMQLERTEMMRASCLHCNVSGSIQPLLYSSACHDYGRWESLSSRAKHFICTPCASSYIMNLVSNQKCNRVLCPSSDCTELVDDRFIEKSLTRVEFGLYSDMCLTISMSDTSKYQSCPNVKCGARTEITTIDEGAIVIPKNGVTLTDDNGKVLSEAAWKHYCQYRCRCHECSMTSCSSCRTIPYHLGKDCASFASYQTAAICRFCIEALTPSTTDSSTTNGLDVCMGESCQSMKSTACTHKLGCGHACYGVKDELNHPICLHESCAVDGANTKGEDYCAICWTEELQVAPVIQLSTCPHYFHQHCVIQKLQKKWAGTRITFGFLNCSQCKVRMDHPSSAVQDVLAPLAKLCRDVTVKATARLSIEGMLKDAKLVDPTSRYHGDPSQYAMDSFAYYNCFKCKNQYFGGRRDCEQNAAAEVRPEDEFVCYDCADLKSVACKVPEHAEYQLWKCRFCCRPAVWFCFGTTHFCDPCHTRPGEVMRAVAPVCPGAASCVSKGDHAPNGLGADSEHNFGCGICQEKQSLGHEERKKMEKVNELIEQNAAAAAGGGGGGKGQSASSSSAAAAAQPVAAAAEVPIAVAAPVVHHRRRR